MGNIPEKCKVDGTMGIFTGKWKTAIILQLMYKGTLRFSELKREIPGVTQKVLTKQLRELEEESVVSRTVYPEVPPRVEYSLTDYGKRLEPLLEEMHELSEKLEALKK
ncbi:HxlR family transcriptional regulator [Listeria weihenstephanensis FSL R9-0317]|uniref:Transcriptional regulator n=1 Tax=Listeria weihenstephanensis TaxID=1006155 RepID=A0A1S7FSV8_9LIST|nr:winged helix-turn-helix transcriptional regulator [Listeria weihenstephanensis]AQY50526.1 HxlR family transcriptional regulator [Listeria weihenstephanensis]EUJ41549.1 HxlR family transcriptional regulator [Listeria weihenstephanensis FSL R9-0317]MBC1500670.1 transcriptional regulator [Listeria weihenstephanensis]